MQVKAPAALLLPPKEEKSALAAVLGGLGGDERGVELEELAGVELGAVVEDNVLEGDDTAAGDVGTHVLVVLVTFRTEFLEVPGK